MHNIIYYQLQTTDHIPQSLSFPPVEWLFFMCSYMQLHTVMCNINVYIYAAQKTLKEALTSTYTLSVIRLFIVHIDLCIVRCALWSLRNIVSSHYLFVVPSAQLFRTTWTLTYSLCLSLRLKQTVFVTDVSIFWLAALFWSSLRRQQWTKTLLRTSVRMWVGLDVSRLFEEDVYPSGVVIFFLYGEKWIAFF